MKKLPSFVCVLLLVLAPSARAAGGAPTFPSTPADHRLMQYFEAEVAALEARTAQLLHSDTHWEVQRALLRQQAAEMLGLHPMPERTPLHAVVTGTLEHEDIVVEKLHFQSLPHLYVTANLYRPKAAPGPLPTVLYVCGHGPVITNGISYGNKVSYQHHGVWFARHGYVCLVIDTVQFGEVLGIHHGTYRYEQWWWNARGYTPAGVEAWNSIRALDYLAARPEVDTNRLAITGRSGGGAYSWFTAALDDRVKVIAPVAGITDLRNHILTGCVEGHCDCMFLVNTYRWDYPLLAALAAPRPLLLVNTDSDNIFPLDGVMRTDTHLRRLYQRLKRPADYGLVIGPGPHRDTQNLQVPVFRWFNQFLKKDDPVIHAGATKPFTPQQLKVFLTLPADAINTNIAETFIPAAVPPPPPATAAEWEGLRQRWLAALAAQCFAGWPSAQPPAMHKVFSLKFDGMVYEAYDVTTQPHVVLRLYSLQRATARRPATLRLWVRQGEFKPLHLAAALPPEAGEVLAALGLAQMPQQAPGTTEIWLACFPRGLGPDAWSGDARKQMHLRRRFMLLGQTVDSMRVWDIQQIVRAIESAKSWSKLPLIVEAEGLQSVNVLYAAAQLPPGHRLAELRLRQLPASHRDGPDYLNVLKVLDVPQALALAAAQAPVWVTTRQPDAFEWTAATARQLRWPERKLTLRASP